MAGLEHVPVSELALQFHRERILSLRLAFDREPRIMPRDVHVACHAMLPALACSRPPNTELGGGGSRGAR
jgi:hypothetical protein